MDHVDCIGDAATDALESSCAIEARVQGKLDIVPGEGLITVLTMTGDLERSLFMAIPRKTAETLAEKFAGCEIEYDSADMLDAIGELANVFAGLVKRRHAIKQLDIELSCPNVLRVSDINAVNQPGAETAMTGLGRGTTVLWAGAIELAAV